MATVNDVSDIVRILREQPEWAETLRGVLLSRELLELPEQFAKYANLTTDTLQVINDRMDSVQQQVNRVAGRLDNELGYGYECKVQRNLASHVSRYLGLRAPTVLKGPLTDVGDYLQSQVERAVMDGTITWDDFSQVLLADLVFTARPRQGGEQVYVLAEISITAGNNDIDRAANRAAILERVLDAMVMPLVVSAQAAEEREQRAQDRKVTIITVPS